MAVNTLQVANRLKAAEREGRAAEELALVLGEIDADRYQSLVTREHLAVELERLRADLSGEIDKLRTELRGEIDKLQTELRGEINELRTELGGAIGQLRSEMEKMELRIMHAMTLRLGGMIAAAVAVLGGINIFF